MDYITVAIPVSAQYQSLENVYTVCLNGVKWYKPWPILACLFLSIVYMKQKGKSTLFSLAVMHLLLLFFFSLVIPEKKYCDS